MDFIEIITKERSEFINITELIRIHVQKLQIKNGICVLFVPHTTAGITINEGTDPDVKIDIQNYLNKIVPNFGDYRHFEGNSDSHIKASMMGSSQSIIIEDGKLYLGIWQAIYFCEFDGPRTRKISIKLIQ